MRIDNDVLEVLSRAEVDGKALKLTGQLERNLYVKVNKVLELCGGKWDKKAKAHLFDGDAAERVDEIIVSGEVEVPKDEFNYFPTPDKVVRQLLELAELRPGMTVLEPSAGRGNIAYVMAKQGGAIVDCYELMEANYASLEITYLNKVERRDFLTVEPEQRYDRVVMNPPFMKQSDVKHVNHALKFLKPGGRLVAVMSAGVIFRSNKLTADFRDMVADRGGEFIELPDAAFKESGTMVRTVIVTIPGA
ncbi:MAG: class I SAM-dependent methyltransferase [Victivallaceae bacterium]|jgi:predicted RNA methylase